MGRKAGSKEFRNKLEERKGTEWYNAASKVGDLYDPHMSKEDPGTARYSGAEIRAEMRHGRGDRTTEEMTKMYEDLYRDGKINLNGNAKEFLRERHGAVLERGDQETTPTPSPTLPPQGGGGQVTGNVEGGDNSIVSPISQDNDVAIMGDGNNVAQDNSITQTIDSRDQSDNRRYYGGSNRVFNYGNMEDRDSEGSKRFLDNFINKSIFNNTNSNVVDFRDAQFGSFGSGEDNLKDMRVFGN